jgi:hypothetical protein
MACILDKGYELTCQSTGGVSEILLGTWESMEFDTDVDGSITNVYPAGGISGDPLNNSAYSFELDQEYGGLDQTGVFNRDNGTVHYESNLSLKMINLDASLIQTLKQVGRAPLYAAFKSNAGVWYFAGVESAGRANEAVASLGTSFEDMNGVNLTIQFKSPDGVYVIDESLIGTDIPLAV